MKECYEKTGKEPIGVKWIGVNKGDKNNPEYRSRLVAHTVKKDKRQDLFAATPPLEANRILLVWQCQVIRRKESWLTSSMLRESFFSCQGNKRSIC